MICENGLTTKEVLVSTDPNSPNPDLPPADPNEAQPNGGGR